MARIETKYAIGDTVWHSGVTQEQRQHPCPDCKGAREWTATSPAGDDFKIPCPRCSASFSARDELSLKYTAHAPRVRRLTIGSVRVDTNDTDKPVSYMCVETGVGSGNIYYERDLYPSEKAAREASEVLAKVRDANVEWVAKRYDRTLAVSDYQLSSAAMQEARDYRSRAGALLYNLTDLFDAINEAGDRDAILEAVEGYKRLWWEADRSKLTEQVPA